MSRRSRPLAPPRDAPSPGPSGHAVARPRPAPEAPLEAVRVEQGHEELEVFLLAVVRRRGHEQEVAATGAEKPAQPIALRVPHLRAEEARRHAVRLVAHHQIPFLRRFEAVPEVIAPAQHVEPGDQVVALGEGIAARARRRRDPLPGQEVEGEVELRGQLVLPLLHQAAGGDDEAAFQVAAHHQLPDQQAGHDGLAGAGIVGEQEAERLARQHLPVDGGDLVRQGLDVRGVDREVRVEEMCETDALGFRGQPEPPAVPAERRLRARARCRPGFAAACLPARHEYYGRLGRSRKRLRRRVIACSRSARTPAPVPSISGTARAPCTVVSRANSYNEVFPSPS